MGVEGYHFEELIENYKLTKGVLLDTDLDADDDCLNCDWNPPTSDNKTKGITLGAPLVISAAKTSVFKTDISNRIADTTRFGGTGSCEMLKPAFTFE